MIYTSWGNRITKILEYHPETTSVLVTLEGDEETVRHRYLTELKADGGIEEIIAAIEERRKP